MSPPPAWPISTGASLRSWSGCSLRWWASLRHVLGGRGKSPALSATLPANLAIHFQDPRCFGSHSNSDNRSETVEVTALLTAIFVPSLEIQFRNLFSRHEAPWKQKQQQKQQQQNCRSYGFAESNLSSIFKMSPWLWSPVKEARKRHFWIWAGNSRVRAEDWEEHALRLFLHVLVLSTRGWWWWGRLAPARHCWQRLSPPSVGPPFLMFPSPVSPPSTMESLKN